MVEELNSQKNYKELYKAFKFWWPYTERSSFSKDVWRSLTNNSSGIFQSGLNMMPCSTAPYSLLKNEFEKFQNIISSDDFLRVNTIDPIINTSNKTYMHVGGSCAIETGLVILINLTENSPKRIENILEAADIAPTFTHISGATLGGNNISVHLLETELWIQQLTSWGVKKEEAKIKVEGAFERIAKAVQKRSELINPDSNILNIDYKDIKTEEATLKWSRQFEVNYNDDARLLQVLYTYLGDSLSENIFSAIKRNEFKNYASRPTQNIVEAINPEFIPMRTKQVDHLNASPLLEIPLTEIAKNINEPITFPERLKRNPSSSFRYSSVLKMLRWNYYESINNKNHNVLSGFIDIPFGDKPAHQKVDWRTDMKGLNRLESSISSIYRLNNKNIYQHFELLEEFLQKNSRFDKEIFPLKTNIFLSHSFNFLWDKDFQNYLKLLKNLEEKKRSSGSTSLETRGKYIDEFKELTKMILPKIIEYYSWIYSLRNDYPSIRYKTLLN